MWLEWLRNKIKDEDNPKTDKCPSCGITLRKNNMFCCPEQNCPVQPKVVEGGGCG